MAPAAAASTATRIVWSSSRAGGGGRGGLTPPGSARGTALVSVCAVLGCACLAGAQHPGWGAPHTHAAVRWLAAGAAGSNCLMAIASPAWRQSSCARWGGGCQAAVQRVLAPGHAPGIPRVGGGKPVPCMLCLAAAMCAAAAGSLSGQVGARRRCCNTCRRAWQAAWRWVWCRPRMPTGGWRLGLVRVDSTGPTAAAQPPARRAACPPGRRSCSHGLPAAAERAHRNQLPADVCSPARWVQWSFLPPPPPPTPVPTTTAGLPQPSSLVNWSCLWPAQPQV